MGHVPPRTSPQRARDGLADFVDEYGLLRPLAVLAILLVCARALFVLLASLGEREQLAPSPDPFPVESLPNPIADGTDDHGFVVPKAWDVVLEGGLTRVSSPSGRVIVTFELGSPGRLAEGSAQLLDSLLETQSEQKLIGMTWERIGGSRSLLVAGTAKEAGRPVRFLAITVHGQPRNYAITISVPARSDPARVLPRLERLVASFEMPRATLGPFQQTPSLR